MQSLLQTQEWADLKVSQGWQSHEINGVFVLEKKLPLGKSFLYAPEVDFNKLQNIQNFLTKIQKISENSNSIFFRLEILDEFDEKFVEIIKQNGFIKAFEELQPEWRQIIDLSKTDEEILAQMKPKGRYNIKIAQRENLNVKKSENIDDFYEIFRKTAKRDGFSIRPKKYFENLLKFLGKNVELLVARLPSQDSDICGQAEYQGKIIAAAIVTYYQDTASYLYGASSNEYRNLMAPYLLHWQAIRRAKEKGGKYYDLLAVAPAGASEKNALRHKYSGITRFKEQFGGRKVHLVGGWDLVYQPTWYKLFKIAERIRR